MAGVNSPAIMYIVMAKVKVIEIFRDANTGVLHQVGEELTVDANRADFLASKGKVHAISAPETKEEKAKPATKEKAKPETKDEKQFK